MPNEHAEPGLGGSTATRTLHCPGWRRLLDRVPDDILHRTSAAAEEGTRRHAEIEAYLQRPAGQELHDKVERALELFDDLLNDLDIYEEYHQIYENGYLMLEQRVALGGIDGAWGTADVVIDHPAAPLVIADWKFGQGVIVRAEGNDSLRYYAAAVIDTLFLPEEFGDDDEVVLAIIQPHGRSNEPELTTERVTYGELRAWKIDFAAALRSDKLQDGKWCQFCPAELVCPKLRGLADRAIMTDPLNAEIAEWLPRLKTLRDFANAIEDRAVEQLEAGQAIPGYVLADKRATAKWTDEDQVFKWLKKKRVGLTEAAPRKLLTPAQMQKLLAGMEIELDDQLVSRVSSGHKVIPDPSARRAGGNIAAFAQLHQQQTETPK